MRWGMLFLAAVIFGPGRLLAERLRDGDVIFQHSQSRQCAAISAATGSAYTHVGLVLWEEGKPYVYEAVQPVVKTPLGEWIKRGRDGHYVVKRLSKAQEILTEEAIGKLRREANRHLGKDYDWAFGWSDDRIYCSELVWKVYDQALGIRVGELRKLRDFQLDHPAVQKLMKERYGEKIPYGETVISPADLFAAKLFVEVDRAK